MLYVRLCTLERENTEQAYGFDLWRSRKKSTSSIDLDNTDLLIVKAVYPDTAAARANLREGDKIIAVDGNNVRTAQDVRELLEKALRVRVMVERWEGPKVETNSRKTSVPTAPPRTVRAPDSGRRRSNTVMSEAELDVQQWPRNYGDAQNYPSAGGSAGRARPAMMRSNVLESSGSSDPMNDADEEPRRSILETYPEGRFLLNAAGRPFYSDDLRGD